MTSTYTLATDFVDIPLIAEKLIIPVTVNKEDSKS